MTTKQGVRIALKTIGEHGLGGIFVEKPDLCDALRETMDDSSLLSPTLLKKVVIELKRQGIVSFTPQNNGTRLGITIEGAHKLLSFQIDEVSIPAMEKWDHKWRLVCFDIPKDKNRERLRLNRKLHELNFTVLQRSMWVHPYECMNEIKVITDYLNLTRHVSVLEIAKLDDLSAKRLLQTYHYILGPY